MRVRTDAAPDVPHPSVARLRDLVDSRTGILTDIESYRNPPEWPRDFRMVAGHVANVARSNGWPSDRISTGMGFVGEDGSDAPMVAAAVGEAVERYCGNFVPGDLPKLSWERLRQLGVDAIDPERLLLYSLEQYGQPDFPFEQFTRDLPVRWVAGLRLDDGDVRLTPASLVYPNFYATRYPGEPRTNGTLYAGLAAGQSRILAEKSALEEIIERDAVEIWWRSGGPAIGMPPERVPGLREQLSDANGELEFTVLAVPNRWRVPVAAVVVFDKSLQILAVGTAARPRMLDAARKAAAEAVSLRSYSKGLLTQDGGAWRAVELGLFGRSLLAPFRADRRYIDSFASDNSDMRDLCCNSQYYLDPRALANVDRLRRPDRVLDLDGCSDLPSDPCRARHFYLERLAQGGVEAISVDLTTSDVSGLGLSVVRVVAPGTYSNAVAGAPFLAGDRWRSEPVELGLRTSIVPRDHAVPPLPHT